MTDDPTAMDAFEAGARRPRLVPFTNQDGSRLIEFTSAEWDAYWHGVEAEAAMLLSRLRDE